MSTIQVSESPLCAADRPGQPKYHIVAPSLPGYGFSSAPIDPGFGLEQMAATLNKLMVQLGYSKYVAQGVLSGCEVPCWHVGMLATSKAIFVQTSNCEEAMSICNQELIGALIVAS